MADNLFFRQLNNYPSDSQTIWSEELQGVTHNADHWFISQKSRIWKIPVGVDLNDVTDDISRGIFNIPIPVELAVNYDHFGGATAVPREQSITQALREAFQYPSFQLLMLGYFVCGFQVVFIGDALFYTKGHGYTCHCLFPFSRDRLSRRTDLL